MFRITTISRRIGKSVPICYYFLEGLTNRFRFVSISKKEQEIDSDLQVFHCRKNNTIPICVYFIKIGIKGVFVPTFEYNHNKTLFIL